MNRNLQRLEDQCKLPVCIFNCCNSQGRCPASIEQCTKSTTSQIWIDIMIGTMAGVITLIAILFLVRVGYQKRKRNCLKKKGLLTECNPGETNEVKEIQCQLSAYKKSVCQQKEQKVEREETKISAGNTSTTDETVCTPFFYIHPKQLQHLRRSGGSKFMAERNNFVIYNI